MNILLLGGNGYLGKKILEIFIADGHFIVCTVRNVLLRNQYSDLDNVKAIPASIDAIETAFRYEKFDLVVNAVCNYGRSEFLYGDVIEANIEFPLKVLDMSVAYGVKRFITIGTGLPNDFNMYSYSKTVFSQFGRFYVEKQKIDFITLKLEMFYGPDEPSDRFIPSIIRKMLSGENVNVTLGNQRRDIIAVKDILNAFRIITYSSIHGYQEISIGTGIAPTISEIVDYLSDITGQKSTISKGNIPLRDNEPDSIADTRALEKLCEWKPCFWKQGLMDMVNDLKTNQE